MTHRKWILLAEDDPQDADLAVRTLGTMFLPDSVVVVVVHDGEEALKCLYQRNEPASKDKSHPTMILLDLKMPKMDGFQVLEAIRGNREFRSLRVIVLTSSQEIRDVNRAYELGASSFLVKPLEFDNYDGLMRTLSAFWIQRNAMPQTGDQPVSNSEEDASK